MRCGIEGSTPGPWIGVCWNPECGHEYVKWLNYEEWRKANPITAPAGTPSDPDPNPQP